VTVAAFVAAFFATTFRVAAFFTTGPLAAEDLDLLALLEALVSVATVAAPLGRGRWRM
jgi:hypothetical protein